jgi:hypothetical protein
MNSSKSQPLHLDFSLPQDNRCGPVLYNVYSSTLQNFIRESIISLLGYADDHFAFDSFNSRFDSFNPRNMIEKYHAICNSEAILLNINVWMNLNRLKLNLSKTEFVVFESRQMLPCSSLTSLDVVEENVRRSTYVKYFGCYLDQHLNFRMFLGEKCRIISLNICHIKEIRKYPTQDSCTQLLQSLVISHLDYANSVLYGLPNCTIKRLQILQNRAAKVVLKWKAIDISTEALKLLH